MFSFSMESGPVRGKVIVTDTEIAVEAGMPRQAQRFERWVGSDLEDLLQRVARERGADLQGSPVRVQGSSVSR